MELCLVGGSGPLWDYQSVPFPGLGDTDMGGYFSLFWGV